MKTIVILSALKDVHARSVQWLLRRRGHECEVHIGTDMPKKMQTSVRIRNDQEVSDGVSIDAPEFLLADTKKIGALWRRRVTNPILDHIHPSDKLIAEKEFRAFNSGLGHGLDSISEFCVNSHLGSLRAWSKIEQLRCARNVGLRIPETLISNSPSEIRHFSQTFNESVIIKSFSSPTWASETKTWCSYARRLPAEILANVEALSSCPAIYQQLIKKNYEVRAFFMGNTCFAVRLNSQEIPRAIDDWRAASTALIDISKHEIPQDIKEKCIYLMQELGIVTGSFDFSVNSDGEYVFFEVNEQGQFLWMEHHCKELSILQAFCDFLESGESHFNWNKNRPNSEESYRSYVESGAWDALVPEERQMHSAIGKPAFGVEFES